MNKSDRPVGAVFELVYIADFPTVQGVMNTDRNFGEIWDLIREYDGLGLRESDAYREFRQQSWAGSVPQNSNVNALMVGQNGTSVTINGKYSFGELEFLRSTAEMEMVTVIIEGLEETESIRSILETFTTRLGAPKFVSERSHIDFIIEKSIGLVGNVLRSHGMDTRDLGSYSAVTGSVYHSVSSVEAAVT